MGLRLIAVLLLTASPATPRQYRAEAGAAAEANAWGAVLEICQAWEVAEPKDRTAPLCVAQALNTLGRHAEVAAPARRSLAIGEGAPAHFYLGVAAQQLDRPEEARLELVRAVELAPDDHNPRRVLGQVLAQLGRYAEARDQAEVEKRLAPSDFGAADRLAFWRLAAGWKFPRPAIVLHGRASWLMDHRRFDDAATALRRALALAPDFSDCHYHLGWCFQQLGDSSGAEAEYRAAIASYPKSEDSLRAAAWYNLSGVLLRRGANQEAIGAIRSAMAINGDRYYFLYALGDACAQAGDQACAVVAWKRLLLSHEPVPEDVRREIRQRLGWSDEPLPAQEPRMPAPPGLAPAALARCEHGLEFMEQRRLGEAAEELEAGLRLAPDFHKCRADLGTLSMMGGQLERAEQELRAARSGAFREVDRWWRGAAAFALAHVLASRPGNGAEGRTLLDEVVRSGYPFDTISFDTLRGTFCEQAADVGCAIEAYRKVLASGDDHRVSERKQAEARLQVLQAPSGGAPLSTGSSPR